MKSYIKKIQRNADKSLRYAEKLLKSDKCNLTNESLTFPIEKGIYIFYFKKNNNIAYIGSGTGQKGLRQRIMYEHLRPSYKEKNKEKSVFREAVRKAEKNKLKIGEEVVKHIKENFNLSYIKMKNEDISFIKLTEFLLIKGCNPIYNTEGKTEDKKKD